MAKIRAIASWSTNCTKIDTKRTMSSHCDALVRPAIAGRWHWSRCEQWPQGTIAGAIATLASWLWAYLAHSTVMSPTRLFGPFSIRGWKIKGQYYLKTLGQHNANGDSNLGSLEDTRGAWGRRPSMGAWSLQPPSQRGNLSPELIMNHLINLYC